MNYLEEYARNHRAVTHHLLENIASTAFGKKETARLITIFLKSYAKFNGGFIQRIEKLLFLLEEENDDSIREDTDALRENLREERGCYDEETLVKCETVGIRRESIENVPHDKLFLDFVNFIEEKAMEMDCTFVVMPTVPEEITEKLVRLGIQFHFSNEEN